MIKWRKRYSLWHGVKLDATINDVKVAELRMSGPGRWNCVPTHGLGFPEARGLSLDAAKAYVVNQFKR